jgi:hypothetical protein
MPITYERAFGGSDYRDENPSKHRIEPRNPIGAGFATRAEHLMDQPLPNVEYPRHLISTWTNRPPPAGFGVIASYWDPRKDFAGTFDENWLKERFPLLPENYDERFNQCSPEDQQAAGFLRGGEPVELINLSPKGRMAFLLPKVRLTFTTRFGKDLMEHRAKIHTVILEPERPRVIMVWCTHLPCHHRVDRLDVTIITQKEWSEAKGDDS